VPVTKQKRRIKSDDKKNKTKKIIRGDLEVWLDHQYDDYMKDQYGMEYVAGFTESGVPYGVISKEENDKSDVGDSPKEVADTPTEASKDENPF